MIHLQCKSKYHTYEVLVQVHSINRSDYTRAVSELLRGLLLTHRIPKHASSPKFDATRRYRVMDLRLPTTKTRRPYDGLISTIWSRTPTGRFVLNQRPPPISYFCLTSISMCFESMRLAKTTNTTLKTMIQFSAIMSQTRILSPATMLQIRIQFSATMLQTRIQFSATMLQTRILPSAIMLQIRI